MGERKKPKKYHKMGYQDKELYVKNELQKLGGSGVYYDNGGARGSASTGMFDLEASEEQLRNLAANDYDRRESIKYGKDSGDKRFKDVGDGGFGSMDELVSADRAIAKYGYNELGHKNMSSNNDYAAVSESLFEKSRNNYGEQFATKDDLSALEKEQAAVVDQQQNQEPYKESESLTKAKERVQEWEESNAGTDPSPYGAKKGMDFKSMAYGANTNRDASGEPANGEQAQGQLAKFKSELKQRKNIKPNF